MRNKRGATLPAKVLVGLIIAIIGIGILVLLIVSISSLVMSNHEKDQAEGTLKELASLLTKLNSYPEESISVYFILLNPRGWYLVGMPKSTIPFSVTFASENYQVTPNENCKDNNCICMCQASGKTLDCANGVCKQIAYKPVSEFAGGRLDKYVVYNVRDKPIGIEIRKKSDSYIFKYNLEELNLDKLFGNAIDASGARVANQFTTFDFLSVADKTVFNANDRETVFYYKLINYFKITSPLIQGSQIDIKRYAFSYVLFKTYEDYKINPLVTLGLFDAETGLISKEEQTGSYSGCSDEQKTRLGEKLNTELDELKPTEPDYTDKIKNDKEYMNILLNVMCIADSLNDIYTKVKNQELKFQDFDGNIGTQKVSPDDDESLAVYYFLYPNVADRDIDKIKTFWKTYSETKAYFRLEINDKEYNKDSGVFP